jgi:hypothetical protein
MKYSSSIRPAMVMALFAFVLPLVTAVAGVKPVDPPELMKTFSGKSVDSVEVWEKVRAPELKEEFVRCEYGRWPKEGSYSLSFAEDAPAVPMMDGKALRKLVRITVKGTHGSISFKALAFIPRSEKPVPAFLLVCNRDYSNIDPGRVTRSGFWPPSARPPRCWSPPARFATGST